MDFSQVGGIILYVKNLEKALVFYTQTLGLEVEEFDSSFVTLKTKGVPLHLHLADNPPGGRLFETVKIPQVYFYVDNIDAAFDHLQQSKVTITRDIYEYDATTFVFNFLDYDGNVLGVKSETRH